METRNEQGDFAPTVTDEQIIEAWNLEQSTKRVAKRVGLSQSQVRKRLAKIREKIANVDGDFERESKLRQLLASVPLDGPAGSRASTIDVGMWGTAAKNAEGDLIKEGLDRLSVRYTLKPNGTVVYPPIGPHYHTENRVYTPLPEPTETQFERVAIWGDSQIAWWRESGNLVPFHDEAAIDVGLQALARYRPHKLVIIGDFLDLPGLGRYRKEPAFSYLMNAAIAYATNLLEKMRAEVGDECEIVYVPGNHEARLEIAILDNLAEIYGVKRTCDAFSVLSIPFLLQFDKFNVSCAEQYPSGEVWLTDNLVCLHGPDKNIAATQICGHHVRATVDSQTRHYRDGSKIYKTFIVPGFGDYHRKPIDTLRVTRTNIPSGLARSSAEQAFGTVDIDRSTRKFSVKVWEIENGEIVAFRDHGTIKGVSAGWTYDEAA